VITSTVIAAALAVAAVSAARVSAAREEAALWMLDRATRPVEPRLSSRPMWRHRPLEVARGEEAREPPSLSALARLQRQGDRVAIAEAYLLRGQVETAQPYLEVLPPTADALSTRAALELMAGKPEEALRHAGAALALSPSHLPARWNRALALRGLGLPYSAATELDAVAAAGEAGWADEARAAAAALRAQVDARRKAYQACLRGCRASMSGGEPFPVECADVSARLTRLGFYDAVRGAGTAERLSALEPAARALDARWGGSPGALERAVASARAAASPARADLSRRYAEAVGRGAGAEAWLALAASARAARQPDLELGALFFVPDAQVDLARYRQLAQQTQDPWFLALADEKAAGADSQRGEPVRALERLAPVEARCAASERVEDRCITAERLIALAYTREHQTLRAREAGLRARDRARRDGDWNTELRILEEIGQTERIRGDLDLARAYLDEALARAPEDCAVQDFARSNLALAHQRALDFQEARRQVDLLARCERPSLVTLGALADLQRILPEPGDLPRLEKGASALGPSLASSAGQRALLSALLGRAWLERDRPKGEALLEEAIAAGERALAESDQSASEARLYGYTSLLLDAGKRGDLRAALALFARERRWGSPPPCSLWLAADDERLLVLAVGRGGDVLGRYDGARKRPLAPEEAPVPGELLAELRRCQAVQVIARPPLEGRPGLLPPDVAWSEVVRQGEALPPVPGPRVVVAGAQPPESLRLPPLRGAPPPSPGTLRLEGAGATPSRVLEALRGASLVEIHAHGVVDPEVADASYLALTGEPSGRFAFTAGDLRGERLARHPLVLLAACHAAETRAFVEQGYGLPEAFVAAGARAVLAATAPVPDAQSEPFFRPLLERIQSGAPAAEALRDARVAWRAAHGPGWADSVLLFE